MNRKLISATVAILSAVVLAQAQQTPSTLNYQGRIVAGGVNFNTTGHFKFALVTTSGGVTTIKWSNDGTVGTNVVPQAFLSLPVTGGLYSVQLGDTTALNSNSTPMVAFPPGLFTSNPNLQLRVWFDDSTHGEQQLAPDQPLASAAYALIAQGVPAGAIGTAQIASGAVTNTQLAPNAVQSGNIAAGAVGSSQLAANASVLSLAGGGGITVSGTTGSITLGSTATSANTASAIVARDGSGSFSAGSITLGGGLFLPTTTAPAAGVIALGNSVFLHNYGAGNTFVGAQAGNFTMTGASNTALGFQALQANTMASENTALGAAALSANTTGANNVAAGFRALTSNTTGSSNVADGFNALDANLDGHDNVALGFAALLSNPHGSNNIAIGSGSGSALSTGNSNIAIGFAAGMNLTSGSDNIYLGNAGIATESNTVRVGTQGSTTSTYIAGIFGASVSGNTVVVNSNGQLGLTGSSERFKESIAPMGAGSEVLYDLQPVSFRYKREIDTVGTPQFGLIAEEVDEVAPDLVVRDPQGKIFTVRYEAVNAMLLNEFLKEHRRAEQEHRRVEDQAAALRGQQRQIEALASRLTELEARSRQGVSGAASPPSPPTPGASGGGSTSDNQRALSSK